MNHGVWLSEELKGAYWLLPLGNIQWLAAETSQSSSSSSAAGPSSWSWNTCTWRRIEEKSTNYHAMVCVRGKEGRVSSVFANSVVSDWVFLLHSSIVLWVHANDANGQKLLQMGGRREEKRRKRSGNKKIQFSLQLATEDRSNSCLTCKLLGMSDTETETVCSFRMGSSKSVMIKSPNVVPCFLSRIFTRSVSIAARIVLQGMTCFYHR